jgi:hypothetical protein
MLIKPDDVARVFDESRNQELAELLHLPAGTDLVRFGDGVHRAVQNAIARASEPTPNSLHREIAALYRAAERCEYERLASLVQTMTPAARRIIAGRQAVIEERRASFGTRRGRLARLEACRLAQNLARNTGWPVFPMCQDKRPATPAGENGSGGFKAASADPERIAWLWQHYPGPLIGIRTGEASGIDVLDIDAKHELALAWWRVAAPRISPTTTYRTRGGGLHLYFQHAKGVTSTTSKLALGVDTRGEGGTIVFWYAAGYGCDDHSPPAPWPPWLLDCVLWQPPPERQTARPSYDDKAIDGILRTVANAREGGRNGTLYWAANRLRERGVSEAEATSLLTPAAATAGLSKTEAGRTITSAWRAAR